MITIFWSGEDGFTNKEYFNNLESSVRRFTFLKSLPDINYCHRENDKPQAPHQAA